MLDEIYADYKPNFQGAFKGELMKLSLQPTFYNRAQVFTDRRVSAHIQEGIKREGEGDYREAIKQFQIVIQTRCLHECSHLSKTCL